MKNAMIFGAGNIGSVLIKKLKDEKVNVKYVVRSNGIFDISQNKIAELND